MNCLNEHVINSVTQEMFEVRNFCDRYFTLFSKFQSQSTKINFMKTFIFRVALEIRTSKLDTNHLIAKTAPLLIQTEQIDTADKLHIAHSSFFEPR